MIPDVFGGISPTLAGLQIGDFVRGTVTYDLAALDLEPDDDELGSYEFPPMFEVVTLVVDNPRDGSAIAFRPDSFDRIGFVEISNLSPDDAEGDFLAFVQTLERIDAPGVGLATLALGGPATTLSDASLPDELTLDDWLFAVLLVEGEFGSLAAEVSSLMPVDVVTAGPADFNFDGLIDGDDLLAWVFGFGAAADGTDLLAWQRDYGAVAQGLLAKSVPEPTAVTLVALSWLVAAAGRGASAVAR